MTCYLWGVFVAMTDIGGVLLIESSRCSDILLISLLLILVTWNMGSAFTSGLSRACYEKECEFRQLAARFMRYLIKLF